MRRTSERVGRRSACRVPSLGCTVQVLAIEPTDPFQNGYLNHTAASWGGNAIFEDGKWHLFVAQMMSGCASTGFI